MVLVLVLVLVLVCGSGGSSVNVDSVSQRDKLIRRIPLEHICLETDSPSLGLDQQVGPGLLLRLRLSTTVSDPDPSVSQLRNEPRNIQLCCRHVAELKGLDPETVRLVTAQNALRLFPKADRR